MPRFRPRTQVSSVDLWVTSGIANWDEIRRLIAEVIAPRHFYVSDSVPLEWKLGADEEVRWELFQGRLLDPAHTTLRRRFEAWSICRTDREQAVAEPLLSVKLDASAGLIHVTRAIYCYAWEGYHA